MTHADVFFLTYLRWGDSALIEDEKELKVQKVFNNLFIFIFW